MLNRNVKMRDRDRKTNIPFLKTARSNGKFVNDITVAMRGGQQLSSIPVEYDSDGSPLNRVSLPLEECPTAYMDVDSEVSETYKYLETQCKKTLETPTQKQDSINNPQNQ